MLITLHLSDPLPVQMPAMEENVEGGPPSAYVNDIIRLAISHGGVVHEVTSTRVAIVFGMAPRALYGEGTPPPALIDLPPPDFQSPILSRNGDVWSVTYAHRTNYLRHSKGMVYLAILLNRPNHEINCQALAAELSPTVDEDGSAVADYQAQGLRLGDLGDAGPVLDQQAVVAYRIRLRMVQKLLRGQGVSDQLRERLETEVNALEDQLGSALGLGGRMRRAAAVNERIRVNVTRTIRAAINRIRESDNTLGQHLDGTVHTGTYCSYRPGTREV